MATPLSLIEQSSCWKFSTEVKQICQPLMDKFGINYFDYARFYPDNTSIQLFSEPEYIKFILTDNEFKCPPGRLHEGKHLWQSYIPSHFLDRIETQYHHFHGLTYVRETSDFTELINFGAPKNNEYILTVFLNYEAALDYFVSYFIKTIEPFLKKVVHHRIILPENFLGEIAHKKAKATTLHEFIQSLNNKTDLRQNACLINLGDQCLTLTHREAQLVSFLVMGWCTKKIARKLNLSVRTVETHFNNIMIKANAQTRLELIGQLDLNTIDLLRSLTYLE